MERHTTLTLGTLRENPRLAREVRQAALERGNGEFAAHEERAIGRLEQRIAQIEARELRRSTAGGHRAQPERKDTC